MSGNRREFFTRLTSLSASLFAGGKLLSAQQEGKGMGQTNHMRHGSTQHSTGSSPAKTISVASNGAGISASSPVPVLTPDIADLPFEMDNGVKVFHLAAEPVKQLIIPGRTFDLWGFNGSAPGPTIQANEGDRIRIVFDNHLPEPTGIHWHGLELPIEMDGVPGIGQKPIMPGERFVYEFPLNQNGTFFYHSHMAMQEMVGMLGGFIIHPKTCYAPHVDKDYLIALQEYAVLPNSTIPNSMNMEFNWLTFNGKAGPASTPLIIRQGERVRIRLINLGMDHHPIHLHGFTFWETGREGARQPEALWPRGNTVLVGVAQARDIEFNAERTGDWMLHCHLPHHMMNQMSSNVGPMTRTGQGMQAGASMEEAMGMLRDGHATSENKGPSLGRGLGVGSTAEMPRTNGPISQSDAGKAMADMPGMDHLKMPGMTMPALPKNADQVPLFPQDAYMEGPMMAMDKEVEKPETYGLPEGWSGFIGGMMTLVRVLPNDRYEQIMDLKQKQQAQTRKGNHA
ncbi:MAG: putative multicopper oxidase [Bryobacterales bacterium]|nr:putative multicopper oxidase [Bryobacterales bacterium]